MPMVTQCRERNDLITNLSHYGFPFRDLPIDSTIIALDFALGRTPWDDDVLEWLRNEPTSRLEIQFIIPDGTRTYVKVRAVNGGKFT